MIGFLWVATALAANVAVVTPDGPVRPGLPALVEVAATDDLGLPGTSPPTLAVSAGTIEPSDAPVPSGVHGFVLRVPSGATAPSSVDVSVTTLGQTTKVTLPVEPIPTSRLTLPKYVDAQAADGQVKLVVGGADLPPPEALQVVTGEGTVTSVKPAPGGLEVTIALPESAFPRFVPVGVRDARRDERPVWTGIRLKTRPSFRYETDPGTKLTVTAGRRSYGPFVAGADGVVVATIEQWPGETQAQAVFTDDIGNQTVTPVPLATPGDAVLVGFPTGDAVPGKPAPAIYLHAVRGDGRPWDGADPACQTPSSKTLPVLGLDAGEWRLDVPGATSGDVRLRCSLGALTEASVRVAASGAVPSALELRVYPAELSTDFPVAEVQASLLDARGEPIPADGVKLWSDRGKVTVEGIAGYAVRAEYNGADAVGVGNDVVHARYDLPPGRGAVGALVVTHGDVPPAGKAVAYARALDPSGRPLAGVSLQLSAGGEAVAATTGADGWASAEVVPAEPMGPVVLEARTPWRVARTVALRDAKPIGGPGSADLLRDVGVRITTGRVSEIDVAVDPEVLYTGPRQVAKITVHTKDRYGGVVAAPPDEMTVSEGSIGAWTPTEDGGYYAYYTPPSGDRARSVEITARAESASHTATLRLEPRPVDRAPSLSAGVVSNFGEVFSPYLSIDFDKRVPILEREGGQLMVRFGAAWYRDTTKASTDVGEPATVSMTMVPITLGVLWRRDYGGRAAWLGLGGVIAPYHAEVHFGDEVQAGTTILPPGLSVIVGAGQRLPLGGEIFGEMRALAVSSPGGQFAYRGPVGGVAGVLGYRVIY